MKKTLSAIALSAIALSASSAAMADTHPVLDQATGWGVFSGGTYGVGAFFGMAENSIQNDTTTATQTVTNTFSLNGTVAKDCSYYGGVNSGAEAGSSHTINLGAIGVKNGATETTSTAFNQAAAIHFQIQSTSAGCNFNNTVKIDKSAAGLQNNSSGASWDPTVFTNKIPYKATAGIGSAPLAGGSTSDYRALVVDTNQSTGSLQLGAWRSRLYLSVDAPAQTLGLIAGTYTDTITLTLSVDTVG